MNDPAIARIVGFFLVDSAEKRYSAAMRRETRFVMSAAAVVSFGMIASDSRADILNFRDWLTANPTTPNSAANEWFGLQNVNGSFMATDGSMWYSPGFPNSTPLMALRTTVGSDNGAAGPATFDGAWAHPGPAIESVLVFEPTTPTWIGGVDVRSELIANGLSGNGVTITAWATISGNTFPLGQTSLTGVNDQTDSFNLPQLTFMQPGDRVQIAFGDNGSFLFDHVNFNAWITVPAPGVAGVIAAMGMLGVCRRRR